MCSGCGLSQRRSSRPGRSRAGALRSPWPTPMTVTSVVHLRNRPAPQNASVSMCGQVAVCQSPAATNCSLPLYPPDPVRPGAPLLRPFDALCWELSPVVLRRRDEMVLWCLVVVQAVVNVTVNVLHRVDRPDPSIQLAAERYSTWRLRRVVAP